MKLKMTSLYEITRATAGKSGLRHGRGYNREIIGTGVSDDLTAVSVVSAGCPNLMFLIYTLGMHPHQ
ncbi:hypothetical protein QUF72_05600 [Desulfobacterales bacterium HSG2]|nr:hypothetical protein [Desulfobacterales bacterium HSG2]